MKPHSAIFAGQSASHNLASHVGLSASQAPPHCYLRIFGHSLSFRKIQERKPCCKSSSFAVPDGSQLWHPLRQRGKCTIWPLFIATTHKTHQGFRHYPQSPRACSGKHRGPLGSIWQIWIGMDVLCPQLNMLCYAGAYVALLARQDTPSHL